METIATILYARVNNFAAICQSMPGDELTAFVNQVRGVLSQAVSKLDGVIAQRRPDSILAVFTDPPGAIRPTHAQRALHAAILAVFDATRLSDRISERPDAAHLPALTISVGVHLGVTDLKPRGASTVHASGEAVEVARLLELTATDLRWSVATSSITLLAAEGRAASGNVGSVGLPDGTFLDIAEVTELVPRKGSTTSPEMYRMLSAALARNRQAHQRALDSSQFADSQSPGFGANFLVEGYRIVRKIGEGGMASIYLAQPAGADEEQVLKVMRMDSTVSADDLQRFIQEFALLAQVKHPNVATIYSQEFSVGHAYIAMEYFPLGDLRARMTQPLETSLALKYLKEIAAGLGAVHAAGIVHRDLKPGNLMLRANGSLALVDFGVAKHTSLLITDTGHGDVIGTPYYLSPEQALGLAVDARCDIYSLGIIAYELLMNAKPYHAASVEALLSLHINGPIPQLRHELAPLQPVLNRLMAKDREHRYPSTQALLDDLAVKGF